MLQMCVQRDTQMMAQHYNEAPEEMRKAELRIGTLTNELERVTAAAQRLEKELGAKQDELKLSENKLHVSALLVCFLLSTLLQQLLNFGNR